jgi:hypothetical protein
MDRIRKPPRRTALAVALGALLLPTLVLAQATTTAPAVPPSEPPDEETPPSSNEGGRTPLDESFGPKSHADWVRETRRKALDDTKLFVQVRSYYLDRDKYDDTESQAWAGGGSIGLKTGYFREKFAIGATGYTSQPLHAPEDKDGTLLLKSGQRGYTVLGELYGEFLINERTRLSIGRRAFDTPYINRNDVRMTPVTFEALTVQGLYGGDGKAEWRVGGGYFDKIKERNSDEFVSMSDDAGAPDDVDNGVYAFGVNYKLGNFSIGAIDYYSPDIINIFYTEAKYTFPAGEKTTFSLLAQYTDETSVGDELLKGTSFDSNQWGLKGELAWGGALFSIAYTAAGGNANMQNPWSGYPGYTSVQVEDFNRDGEDAILFRAGYKFKSLKGFSVYGLYVDGSDPDSPSEYAKDEFDLNLQWNAPADSALKGVMARLRYAQVDNEQPGTSDLKDLRFMVFWDPTTP